MATYQELNKIYQQKYNIELPRRTLTRWVRQKEVLAKKETGRYDYDLDSFIQKINSTQTQRKTEAHKAKPQNYIGTLCGKLLIKGIVPKNEYKEDYQGTLMYCDCLNCGRKNIQVRFSYLSGNGNYTQETCGCGRAIYAFLMTSKIPNLSIDWLFHFKDFDKFLFIHRALQRTTDLVLYQLPLQEYQNMIEYFYKNEQFNILYSNWKKSILNSISTYYDWWKPSLDHIIPKSKGGTDSLDNLQFLTVFENLAKRDLTMDEWNQFKKNTNTSSDLFIETIMTKGGKDLK